MKDLVNSFAKFSNSENNYVYSITSCFCSCQYFNKFIALVSQKT